jgi:phosphatidylglycerophosphatase A
MANQPSAGEPGDATSPGVAPAQRTFGQRLLLFVGSLGPLGHTPGSGTVTVAVVGVPMFWALDRWMSDLWLVVFAAVFAALSIALHHYGDRVLGEKDSGKLVWDELAGFWVAILFVPFSWPLAIAAFFLERFLDIIKFPPARWVEKHVPGGWGVVGDDLIAGAYTCLALHTLGWLAPEWVGGPQNWSVWS